MHRDWFMEGANVFVEIYTDRIEISSPGGLPKGMKLADLGRKSIRRNALIADLLHRITFIEKAGTGIKRMREEAQDQHCPAPIFEENGFFTAIFYPNPEVRAQAETTEGTKSAQVGTKLALSWHQVEILRKCSEDSMLVELMLLTGRSDRTKFRNQVLTPLLEAGFIEMTIPEKPNSSKQRYRITPAGRIVLEKHEKEANA
jgi:ATP-dependent DNA helicase RecG